jgi:methylphosphotriester-DNA--protein-cysteine methyltransferase
MDIILLTTAAITLLKPFLTKAGDKIAEAVGEDFYKKVKGLFKRKEDNQLLEKAETGPVSQEELVTIEDNLKQEVPTNELLQTQLKKQLDLTPARTSRIQDILYNIQKLRKDLESLNKAYLNAGIANAGDYKNRIALQQEKLEEEESELYEYIYKSH